jgi:hypothetical protein
MARRSLTDAPDVDPPNAQPDHAPAPSKLAAPRLSFQLTPDESQIDLARMQPGNREKLARVLTPATLKELGVIQEPKTPEAAAADSVLDTMLGGKAVELVGLLAVIGSQRALGLSPGAAALMAFRPEQREALAPLVVRILSKYNLLGGKYAEEMAAAALAVAMLADNYQKAKDFDSAQKAA